MDGDGVARDRPVALAVTALAGIAPFAALNLWLYFVYMPGDPRVLEKFYVGETRLSLLRAKSAVGSPIPDEILKFLADNLRGNVRELEGAIHSLRHFSRVTGRKIDQALAREALTVPETMKADDLLKQMRRHKTHQAIVIDVAVGTLWIASAVNKRAAEQFPKLIGMTRERGGHAVMFAAPPHLKEGHDVWGSSAPSLSLMREIKQLFDPKGILNPGRFVAGL